MTCPNCGAEIPAGATHCANCGHEVEQPPSVERPPSGRRPLASFCIGFFAGILTIVLIAFGGAGIVGALFRYTACPSRIGYFFEVAFLGLAPFLLAIPAVRRAIAERGFSATPMSIGMALAIYFPFLPCVIVLGLNDTSCHS